MRIKLRRFVFMVSMLFLACAWPWCAYGTEGYYKDIFIDAGVHLVSRTDLPAVNYLGLSSEYISLPFKPEDEKKNLDIQQMLLVASDYDDNGVLLYPDGQPRFRCIHVNGGKATRHGNSLGEQGRSRIRKFFLEGGSYIGTCAGAFFCTLGRSYLHIWPAWTHSTGLSGATGHSLPEDSPLLEYYDFGGDGYIASVRHGGGCYVDDTNRYCWTEDSEVLLRYAEPVESKDSNRNRPLFHYPVCNNDSELVELFLAHGARLGAKDADGWTVLRHAVSRGYRDLAEFLVSKGAEAPEFHLAACMGDLGRVKGFLQEGADVDVKDELGWTPLHWAVSTGREEAAELLISKSASIDAKTDDERTVLQQAIQAHMASLVELLLSKGSDVNTKDKQGNTPLHSAASAGHKEVVELLVSRGAKVNVANRNGVTALHKTAGVGHADIAALLIAKGADANAKNSAGYTPLHCAAERGRKDIVELLIAKGADVNAKNNNGQTPIDLAVDRNEKDIVELLLEKGAELSIHLAAYFGDIDKVKSLIETGVSVNVESGPRKRTPLYWAVRNQHKDVAKLLIDNGADVSSINLLYYACWYGYRDFVELFIQKGADANSKSWGESPSHYAAWGGHADVLELLLAKGADVNAKENKGGQTPLHCAVEKDRTAVAELLIIHGADVNAKDKKGQTPLSLAKDKGHKEIVELLRKHGAIAVGPACDPEEVNELNKSLLEAATDGNIQQVKELLSKGADIDAKDNEGYTPLSWAVRGNHRDVIKVLVTHGANVNFTPDWPLAGKVSCWAYKQNENTGRLVVIGSHPERVKEGEKRDLMSAMIQYAIEGNGKPNVKGCLENGIARQMNNNAKPGHEKIGDKQYHHFTVEVPPDTEKLTVSLRGDDDVNDLNLFARYGDFAFKGLPGIIEAQNSKKPRESISIDYPQAGTWYFAAKGVNTVSTGKTEWGYRYTGDLSLLNGISYSIIAYLVPKGDRLTVEDL